MSPTTFIGWYERTVARRRESVIRELRLRLNKHISIYALNVTSTQRSPRKQGSKNREVIFDHLELHKTARMVTEVAQLPHIEVFHRVMELPMIESAISKSAATYSRVKDCNQLLHWALTTAEISLSNATKQAVPIAAPIAKKLENPIHFVDHTLCLGLDKIEEKVPLVKEKPEQILENAYTLARQTVQPAVSSISLANDLIISQALNLRDKSWNKANQILETQYGSAAVRGLDSTADVVDKLIDKYFPGTENEQSIVINTNEEDKLLHTLQTVGRLSNKAARRVYANIIYTLGTINTENFRSYIRSLVQFLQLTNRHAKNKEIQTHATQLNDTSNAESKKSN